MFVTIRRYQGKPGQTEETVSRVERALAEFGVGSQADDTAVLALERL